MLLFHSSRHSRKRNEERKKENDENKMEVIVAQLAGRVGVASDARGPWFKSSHSKNFMIHIFTVNCRKDKNKEKEAWKMALLKGN